MKRNGSANANASVAKNTARKMLNIPFCAYCVQISTTALLSATDAFVTPSSLMFFLMNSTAIGASRHRLHRRPGEPIDYASTGKQPQQERRVQDGQFLQIRCQTVS